MKNLLLAALSGLLLAAPAAAQPGIPAMRSLAQLQDSLRHVMAREHIPGLMLTLVSHDSVLFEGGLGLADVATQRPVTAHTRFRIGSVTKTFVVVGLLQLIEQGKLRLNDEVHKIALETPIDNPWEATDPVRVVHLLEHTAGFDDMRLNHVYNPTSTDPRGTAALAVFRDELRCRWRPGERMSYANPGYQVAGYLLEKFSGQPYEQYLTAHLLRPLAMPDASPALRLSPGPGMSQGYKFADGHYQAVPQLPIYAGPAGSMSASAADMTQWVRFFLREGRAPNGRALLQPASVRELETVHSSLTSRVGITAGYALANESTGLEAKAIFRGHGGGIGGFISAFGYNRELGVGYAFSNNGGQSAPKLEKFVQAFLLRQLPVPAPLPRVPLDAAAVAPYLGHYRSGSPRNELSGFISYLSGGTNLRREGDFLLNEPLIGKADTLLPTGPLTFRFPAISTAHEALTQNKDGRRVLIKVSDYAIAAGFWWWLPPALVGLVQVLRRKIPRVQLLPRVLPLAAVGALVATLVALTSFEDHLWTVGQPILGAVVFSLGPLVFVALTAAGLVLTVRYFRQFRRPAVAWYLLLTYGALGWLAAVLGAYGWMGLRLWSV